MKKGILAAAAAVLIGMPGIAQDRLARTNTNVEVGAAEESIKTNALVMSLLQQYKELLAQEKSLTPEQQRQIANALDEAQLAAPYLSDAVAEVYRRFRGDRVLAGVSLGIGGEGNVLQSAQIPVLKGMAKMKNVAFGINGQVGVAGVVIRNVHDNTFSAQVAGYYLVGGHGGTGYGTSPRATAKTTRGEAQIVRPVWRFYFVTNETLAKAIPPVGRVSADHEPVSQVYGLGGTYIGLGTEQSLNSAMLGPLRGTWTTEVLGRFNAPANYSVSEIVSTLSPEVIVVSLSKTVGSKGPRLAALGELQYLKFVAPDQKPSNAEQIIQR